MSYRTWIARGLCAVFVVAASACGRCSNDGSQNEVSVVSATAAPKRADGLALVVVIVIDQLPSWTFTRDASQLGGGIGRLLRESVYFPKAAIPYANTYTAPGHATIGTGVGPNRHGILANAWNHGRGPTYLPATLDPEHPVYDVRVGEPAAGATVVIESGASPRMLKVEGIADVLAREKPNARSVVVGLKQRASTLMLGRRPNRAVWYESTQLAMTTSSYFGEMPAWLSAFNQGHPATPLLAVVWDIDDRDYLRRYTGVDDDAPGEGAASGMTTSFPHLAKDSPAAARVFRMMPASVDYLLASARFAIEAEQLGQRGVTDLLALTISTHDYVGHFWGQESWERFDMLRKTDEALATFFESLDAFVGIDGYAVLLTSDHGAEPLVERSIEAGRDARRIMIPELTQAVDRGLDRVLGPGLWVDGYGANSIYMSAKFRRQRSALQREALASVLTELRKIPNVALAELTAKLAGDCDKQQDELRRVVCESIHPDETGDITVVPERYSLFQSPKYTTGTGHGTPSLESRQVPVLVREPGVAPMQSTARVTTYQIAPTLARLLGISPPGETESKPLPLVADPTETLH